MISVLIAVTEEILKCRKTMATGYELEGDAVERKGRLEGIWGVSQWLALLIFSYVRQLYIIVSKGKKPLDEVCLHISAPQRGAMLPT